MANNDFWKCEKCGDIYVEWLIHDCTKNEKE